MRDNLIKFLLVIFIVFAAVVLDQWSKQWADDSLSTMRYPDHAVVLTVPDTAQNITLEQFIKETYPDQPELNQKQMIISTTKEGGRIFPTETLNPGDKIEIHNLSLTVIEGYFDYQYARNTGAAFSFMADKSPEFRKYFFGATSILAVLLILAYIGFSSWKKKKPLIIFLAIILGGAVGNILDRVRLGYVIDFISWHVGEHYWPTFNVADVFVTCGVALLVIDLIVHRKEEDEEAPKDDEKKLENKTEDKAEDKAEKAEKAEDKAEKAEDKADKAEKAEKAEDKAEKAEDKAEKAEKAEEKADKAEDKADKAEEKADKAEDKAEEKA